MACTQPADDAAVRTPQSPLSPHPPHAPCPLEALNTDCLTLILGAIHSLADLGAFIRASPTVLRCFLSAKALILRHVMTNELGPAIRDALAMSLTDNIDMFAAGTFQQNFDNAIRAWRESLLADKPPWVPPLTNERAADMARLVRLVLRFVDLYTSLRLRHFREALDPPCAGDGAGKRAVTQTERRRIAQALMRSQILVSLHGPSFEHAENADSFFALALGLFASWEMDQMSTMAHFVVDLIAAWRRVDRRNIPRSEPLPPINRYHAQHFFSLASLYARLEQAQLAPGGARHGEMLREPVLSAGKTLGAGTRIRWLRSSHRWVWVRAGDPPAAVNALLAEDQPRLPGGGGGGGGGGGQGEDAPSSAEVVFEGDDYSLPSPGPPWGWIHAWDGQRVRRWGIDLVLENPPAGGDWDEHECAIDLARRWKWLGMVFWDRDRAEALLETRALERCRRPGWLSSYNVSGRLEAAAAVEQPSGEA